MPARRKIEIAKLKFCATFSVCQGYIWVMRMNRACLPKRVVVLVCLALVSIAQAARAADKKPKNTQKTQTLSEHDRALHALQRLTFGPRPGDLERVLATGVDNWIAQQLDPAQIPDPVVD